MHPLIVLSIIVLTAHYTLAKEDQCPQDLYAKVEFYRGEPPTGDLLSGGELQKLFKALAEGLAGAFKKEEYNFTWPEFNFNFTEEFNASNVLGVASYDAEQTTPATVVTEAPKRAKEALAAFAKVLPRGFKNGAKNLAHKGMKKATAGSASAVAHKKDDGDGAAENSTTTTADPLNSIGLGEDDGATELSEDSWGIVLPGNTIKAELARIQDNAVRKIAVLDRDIFASNKTKNDSTKFVRYVDLREFDLTQNDAVIVCLTLAVVKNDKQSACQRCVLASVCSQQLFDSECAPKFLSLRGAESTVLPRSASLQFLVNEPPLEEMKFVARLRAKPTDQRCESSSNHNQSATDLQQASKLFANTLTYLDVENLLPKNAYSVHIDLKIDFNEKHFKAPFADWPSLLILHDYLESSKDEIIIHACGSEK